MSDVMRLFIAVKIPLLAGLRPVLRSLDKMGQPVQPVAADNLHVTLKFLGDTSSSLLNEIQTAMVDAVAQSVPFVVKFENLGAFPNADRPSVVWAGLTDADPLTEIAERLNIVLESLGFERESYAFHPHLTLARIKARPPQELFDLLHGHQQTSFGEIEVHAIELIRSEPHRDGSRYTVLSTHEFGGA
jgi:2'-5' RNA ligase